jgi:hypothetical protein
MVASVEIEARSPEGECPLDGIRKIVLAHGANDHAPRKWLFFRRSHLIGARPQDDDGRRR